jgi:hypothetical protein
VTRKKQKHYDPDWTIQDDEFHPNLRKAAKHADENAKLAAERLREQEERRAKRPAPD